MTKSKRLKINSALPAQIPFEEAEKLSPGALAARFAVEVGKRKKAEEEAGVKAELEAEKAARDFIDNFLDNHDYQNFAALLEKGDIEGADAFGMKLAKQIDELAEKAPKFKEQLIRIKDKMIATPLAKATAEKIK